jgi:isocitrate dehydrogenase
MKITLTPGLGVGPEVTDLLLDVFRAADVPHSFEEFDLDPDGNLSEAAVLSAERTGLLLHGPLSESGSAPSDELRDRWSAFASKRVFRMFPGVPTPIGLRPLNLTLVQELTHGEENAADLMLDGDRAQHQRIVSRKSALRLHRYVFAMAERKGATRVTCGHRADVRRISDGLFLECFYEVAQAYPHLRADDVAIDRLARRLVVEPEAFDVLVVPPMDGDILADLSVGLVGGISYAPAATIAEQVACFGPQHGARAKLAGTDRANPSAMILAGCMLLRHTGFESHAERIEAALQQALYQLQHREDLRRWVPKFRTSVFRHLLLSALVGKQRRPVGMPLEAPRRQASTSAPVYGLWTSSLAPQLEGLA